MVNKNIIPQQSGSSEPSRKKFKISKYKKTETILLEWFCQKGVRRSSVAT
jgi:hypothetical protein